MIDAQVLILGAGPGGCATALALLGAGVEGVVLVNKPARTPFRIGESATPDVSNLLKRLGLSASLSQAGHCEYHANLSLWGGVRRIDDFLRRGKGHGWHLDRAAFDESLRRAAIDRGARLFSPATAADLARRDGAWQVGVDLGGTARERVRALVLVDAAGRRAPLACRLGATRYRIDRMVALAHVAPACSGLAGLVLTEPFAEGWWYAAKRPDDRAIVTLMTDADIARRRGWRHWACYREAWEETAELRLRVPPPQRESLVATFPAHSGFTDRAAGAGWIAVGDAIISFDPLTSSGIAGALGDALAAAETIRIWLDGTADPAGAATAYGRRADAAVKRYLAERRDQYESETRWPESPFWARRNGRVRLPGEWTPKGVSGVPSELRP